jgi:uncharacterized protein with PIN domain
MIVDTSAIVAIIFEEPEREIMLDAMTSAITRRISTAKLNFGDCFSYALAIDFDEPLLFKGNDFNHTDVRMAIPPT